MGIYISGVKGLPEQVQANKEDIKTIKEEIEGIDFEQIRQLETQVGENTQDINNLEAAIGVQNQAINGLKDRADALESKTQLITYNSDYGMTDFRNSIEVADDVYASNVRVIGDGSLVNTSQSGIHFKEGANDDTLTIANNDGATPHYLHFKADGTLDIDGAPVGSKALYMHDIYINIKDTANFTTYFLMVKIINDSNEAFTFDTLKTYIADGTRIQVSGGAVDSNNIYKLPVFLARDNTNYRVYSLSLDTNFLSQSILNSSIITFNDTIRQIA